MTKKEFEIAMDILVNKEAKEFEISEALVMDRLLLRKYLLAAARIGLEYAGDVFHHD